LKGWLIINKKAEEIKGNGDDEKYPGIIQLTWEKLA